MSNQNFNNINSSRAFVLDNYKQQTESPAFKINSLEPKGKLASLEGGFDPIGWSVEQIFKFLALVVIGGYVVLNENTPKLIEAIKALGIDTFNNCKSGADFLITLIQKGPKAASQGNPKVEAFLNQLLKNPEIKKLVNQYKAGKNPFAFPVTLPNSGSSKTREQAIRERLQELHKQDPNGDGIHAEEIRNLLLELEKIKSGNSSQGATTGSPKVTPPDNNDDKDQKLKKLRESLKKASDKVSRIKAQLDEVANEPPGGNLNNRTNVNRLNKQLRDAQAQEKYIKGNIEKLENPTSPKQ